MKKKILSVVLSLILVVSLAACGGKTNNNTPTTTVPNSTTAPETTVPTVDIKDSADILNQVYEKFTEDQTFPVMGGKAEDPVMDGAGLYPVDDKDGMMNLFHIPEKDIDLVSEVGSMMHAMNANTFTSTVYKLKDAKTSSDFISSLKDNIKNTKWLCGAPETLLIYTVNDSYVVVAFGADEIIKPFKANMATIFDSSAVLSVEESLLED